MVHSINLETSFVPAFKVVVLLKIQYVIAMHLMR